MSVGGGTSLGGVWLWSVLVSWLTSGVAHQWGHVWWGGGQTFCLIVPENTGAPVLLGAFFKGKEVYNKSHWQKIHAKHRCRKSNCHSNAFLNCKCNPELYDQYVYRIPDPKHTLKYTEVKVPHTQYKHTQLSSLTWLSCSPAKSLADANLPEYVDTHLLPTGYLHPYGLSRKYFAPLD